MKKNRMRPVPPGEIPQPVRQRARAGDDGTRVSESPDVRRQRLG